MLVGQRKQVLLAALQGPAEPPGTLADRIPVISGSCGLPTRSVLGALAGSTSWHTCGAMWISGGVSWPKGHRRVLPAAARTALAEAAAALQAELDVAHLAGVGL